ncbi:MAG: GNAT family N-acetyltransferase [Syntrophaceae bacterium]
MNNREIIFREEVKTSDIDHVRQLVEGSGFFSPEELLIAVELVEERLSDGKESGYYFLFAERSGDIIGYTCFGPVPDTVNNYDIYWIVVHNDFRRLGIGKSLITMTEKLIEQQGGKHIYIDTSSRDQYRTTRLFYSRCGYRKDAFVKDFYNLGDSKITYVKDM